MKGQTNVLEFPGRGPDNGPAAAGDTVDLNLWVMDRSPGPVFAHQVGDALHIRNEAGELVWLIVNAQGGEQ